MRSFDYRQNIRNIIKNVMRRKFPGLKKSQLEEAASEIAKGVHARFYGANVDNVETPIWRDDSKYHFEKPTIDAAELLK